MLALLALASIEATYKFPAEKPYLYEMTAEFNGYLPVFGGREAQVEIAMTVEALGKAPDAEGRPQVTSELKAIKATMNGAVMPLTIENFRGYFPKTTVSISPSGKVLKTDAPNINLPVRLPALDVKRFPDISYLPIEFPTKGIETTQAWRFTKSFGGSDMSYDVRPIKVTDELVELALDMSQVTVEYEDAYGNRIEGADKAARKVTTTTTGKGTATYDRALSLVTEFSGEAVSNGKVQTLKSGEIKDTKLVSKIRVLLKKS